MLERNWTPWLLSSVMPAFLLTACGDPEPPPEMEQELSQLRGERDSLEAELSDVGRRAGELRDEVAQIELPEEFLAELDEAPRTAGDSLRALTVRAESAEEERRSAESRAWIFQQRVDSLRSVHDSTAEAYESQLDDAQETIRGLERELEEQRAEIDRLEGERERLGRALEDLEGTLGTAYYVIGTRDELLDRGVIREAGGARFLGFLWKRGEVAVPVRDLDEEQFTMMDLREDREVPLPRTDVLYRIVSRHNPDHLGPEVGDDGSVRGDRLQIRDPEAFWATSRFLIIMEEG